MERRTQIPNRRSLDAERDWVNLSSMLGYREYGATTIRARWEICILLHWGKCRVVRSVHVLCHSFDHGVWDCKKFYNRGVDDRWKIEKERKLCFHCVASDHMGKDCPKACKWGIHGCSKNHHGLLRAGQVFVSDRTDDKVALCWRLETSRFSMGGGTRCTVILTRCNIQTWLNLILTNCPCVDEGQW